MPLVACGVVARQPLRYERGNWITPGPKRYSANRLGENRLGENRLSEISSVCLQFEDRPNEIRRLRDVERGLSDEQDRRGVEGGPGLATLAGGERQQVPDKALVVVRDKGQRDAVAPRCAVAED